MHQYRRNLTPTLLAALADTPIVYLHGARQCGKTTLVRELAGEEFPARFLSFDDRSVWSAAAADPARFLAGLGGPVILDEVQRVPELFLALKAEVDRDRRPGRFLLTGSAHALAVPQVASALVGRLEMLVLYPLSQGEIAGRVEDFIAAAFNGPAPLALAAEDGAAQVMEDLVGRLLAGGFPEPLSRTTAERRRAWFEGYVTTLMQREVRDLSQIEDLAGLSRLLSLLGTRAATLLSYAELSRTTDIAQTTLKRYLTLLEATFLIQRLPAWSAKLAKRLTKSPKVYLTDTGLLAHVLGLSAARLASDPHLRGPLWENFVVQELSKQRGWSRQPCQLFHYRTHTGQEVDVVLEDPSGRVVGVEVKAGSVVTASDFRTLKGLRHELGERFVRGVVLYAGTEALPFGERLEALPISALWRL